MLMSCNVLQFTIAESWGTNSLMVPQLKTWVPSDPHWYWLLARLAYSKSVLSPVAVVSSSCQDLDLLLDAVVILSVGVITQ